MCHMGGGRGEGGIREMIYKKSLSRGTGHVPPPSRQVLSPQAIKE